MAVRRYSSRRERLDSSFLTARLQGAKSYDRIAGYFSSSALEIAGEAIESVTGKIRMICNSGLDPRDVSTAKAAEAAMRREWCASQPERLIEKGGDRAKDRFARLYEFLRSGKLEVKVLPDNLHGLIHGKAGVITLQSGAKTSFMGSVNESVSGWRLNHELLWEDDSPESVTWVQEEFDALFFSPFAFPLARFVMEDVARIGHRTPIASIEQWKEADAPDPASVIVEAPVYRKNAGLWEHQKFFVKLAFEAHLRNENGARFVLADQVGLGKTAQLAMVAELIALSGDKPVLVLAPKTLLAQWQGDMLDLLDAPSAYWNGKQWVDENEIEHPVHGPEGIRRCPRRIGLVSTGLVTAGSEVASILKSMTFDCVIVDEAHRARRRNHGPGREGEDPEPNNLLRFLYEISKRTRTMLLATATPVQLYPVEAWDLLDALSRGSEAVLGNTWSHWQSSARAVALITDPTSRPTDESIRWDWVRSPMPPAGEHRDFEVLRRSLDMEDSRVSALGADLDRLRPPDRARLAQLFPRFVEHHNPFIRHIVRRTREFLENTLDPETREPYLKKVEVRLSGERDEDAIKLPLYLKDAYALAEEFCRLLAARQVKGSGFLKTLLLRRVGSTVFAGKRTAERMLANWADAEDAAESDEEPVDDRGRTLTDQERSVLIRFVSALEVSQDRDPKYAVVLDCLTRRGWLERGCIVFSQYFESIQWLSTQLMADLPEERIAIYAGAGNSGVIEGGVLRSMKREDIKDEVRAGKLRLMLGTDAASEGLNLQRLGTLINLDLPWNPTRLEQRKGRIQRIGQLSDIVDVYNMRYLDSVEDRVHHLLSERLEEIYTLFGQLPDVLSDVWIDVALGEIESARKVIDAVPRRHPFDVKYQNVERVDWESCARVLDASTKRAALRGGW